MINCNSPQTKGAKNVNSMDRKKEHTDAAE
jgi:hypothetical protein